MQNFDVYWDEIVEAIKDDDKMCCFMRDEVLPYFLKDNDCKKIGCNTCAKMFTAWMFADYVEQPKPEVDWNKVPVDTLVRVRDSEDEEWRLRYFKRFINGSNTYQYVTWQNGATSKTANKNAEGWKYCELVEDEDDEE
jgi:hypothetical protein